MALAPGVRLGPYEIVSALGAGGMGEVYKARDTRLDRMVAIKVLPEHVATDSELKQRFEREAKTISSLNHPHICTLHDVGSQDGIDFLVMEHLEGETLADRLRKGALPLDQALQTAIQIADALDKAHRQRIVHRDLKPGNIMLTKAGAKLLDFGLAKLRPAGAAGAVGLSEAPTISSPLTGAGSILGTFQYMAPEQLEGQEADARTDIFAFGAVVYEMVTGKKAFEGKSQASLIGAIMNSEPTPISNLQPMSPPTLDRVVKKCLAKSPDRRWQSAQDLHDELQWITEAGSQVGAATLAVAAPLGAAWRRAMPLVLASLAVGAIIAGLAVWNLQPTPVSPPVSRFAIPLPPEDRVEVRFRGSVAISPDGSQVVYAGSAAGGQLNLRRLDSPEVSPILGTQGGQAPFFSPDGEWLGFWASGKLMKVAVNGGPALTVCDPCDIFGATWGPDDTIVFSSVDADGRSRLFQIPAAGGVPTALTQPASAGGEFGHAWPEFLPGGNTLLFTSATSNSMDAAQIEALNLESGERRVLVQGGTYPRYAPTGHLVYHRAGTLMAVPFDPDSVEVTGEPAPVLEGLLPGLTNATFPTGSGVAHFGFSRTGSLVYLAGGEQAGERPLVWVDRTGAVESLGAPPRNYVRPTLSPDGRQIALNIAGDPTDVWVYDIARGTLTRLTFEGNNFRPVWTPDGTRIVFPSDRGGSRQLFWKSANGAGTAEQLTNDELSPGVTSISPDGKLALVSLNPTGTNDIGIVELQGERNITVFLKTPFDEGVPVISPDGRWVAHLSTESGRPEIYVRPFPGPGGKWQISTEGGVAPVWARNGRELFWASSPTGQLMAVDITTEPAGTPRVVLEESFRLAAGVQGANYDVSPDGQRFLMVPGGAANLTQLNVVLNWFEELKARVPVP